MKDKPAAPPAKQIQIKIDAALEGGVYSNSAAIMHSENEFILDFGVFVPGRPEIKIVSRVVTNPRAAKQLAIALQKNVQAYEKRFGEITPPQRGGPEAALPGFTGGT